MENFGVLLNDYIDEEEIERKVAFDNREIKRENDKKNKEDNNIKQGKDMSKYKKYTIPIFKFMIEYVNIDPFELESNYITHKSFKYLTIDNPLVIGISNDLVDVDELKRKDYLLVRDSAGNLGAYLNPDKLRDLTKLEIIERNLELLKKDRIYALEDLSEFYKKFNEAYDRVSYLNSKCSKYYEMLEKAKKEDSVELIKKFVNKHGSETLDIDLN